MPTGTKFLFLLAPSMIFDDRNLDSNLRESNPYVVGVHRAIVGARFRELGLGFVNPLQEAKGRRKGKEAARSGSPSGSSPLHWSKRSCACDDGAAS